MAKTGSNLYSLRYSSELGASPVLRLETLHGDLIVYIRTAGQKILSSTLLPRVKLLKESKNMPPNKKHANPQHKTDSLNY